MLFLFFVKVPYKVGKIVGYARVSSKGQLDNNSMEQQEQEILNRYSSAIIYSEQFTGTTTQRPIFNEFVKNLNMGDTLVVCKPDRLARNTTEGIELVQGLFNKGAGKNSYTEVVEITGISKSTLIREVRKRKEYEEV